MEIGKKRFGLFYSNKDGKQYLYRSYYTLPALISDVESEKFQEIEKTSISVVDLVTGEEKSEVESNEED